MRDKGQVGQLICSCGRVAELRTRNNGRRLPFFMCKACGMQQGKAELRAEWLSQEDSSCSLGEYGKFPQTPNETSTGGDLEVVGISNQDGQLWVPPSDLDPKVIEAEAVRESENTGESSNQDIGLLPKVGFAILSAFVLGLGIKKINLARQVKG